MRVRFFVPPSADQLNKFKLTRHAQTVFAMTVHVEELKAEIAGLRTKSQQFQVSEHACVYQIACPCKSV